MDLVYLGPSYFPESALGGKSIRSVWILGGYRGIKNPPGAKKNTPPRIKNRGP